jgi:diguanylate cyclase (GGDEF)-like protein
MKAQLSQVIQQLYEQVRLKKVEVLFKTLQAQNVKLVQALEERDDKIQALQVQIANYQARLKELQRTDELTDLSNQYNFREDLLRALKCAVRLGYSLSLMLIDIDQLREINTRYGTEIGDKVLTEVAKILRNSVREIDVPARWSGHELAAILHETDATGASAVAERVRKRICMLELSDPKTSRLIKISASIALSTYPKHGNTPESLLEYAQEAMREVKNQGKNSFIVAAR